jgi:chromosome segregation ATPase
MGDERDEMAWKGHYCPGAACTTCSSNVCGHGRLKRKCEHCDDADEIAQLRAKVAALTVRAEKAEARVAELTGHRARLAGDLVGAHAKQNDLMALVVANEGRIAALTDERRACLARTERAERERDEAIRQVEALERVVATYERRIWPSGEGP